MRLALLPAALLFVSFFGGCSRQATNRAEVSGKIMIDHQPLAEGSIAFFPVEGTHGPTAGAIIQDGGYHIPAAQGVAVGHNRVEIRGFRKSGKRAHDVWKPGEMIDETVSALAPEYNDQSTLFRDVREGLNQFDFNLPGTLGQ